MSNQAYVYATPTGTSAYAVDGLNQLDSIDGVTVSHDSLGNVTGALGKTWGYDDLNRLTSANAGAGAATFTFDPLSRLATSTVGGASIRRQYVGAQLVAEYNVSTGALTKRYIPGLGLDDVAVTYDGSGTATRNWLLADERGSVIGLSGSTGAVSNINTYDSYGVPASGNAGRFQYTGQQWLPEAGAYHYRARSYLPQIGRFLQTDPIGYAAGQNLYAYVHADPVNQNDPMGLQEDDCRPVAGSTCLPPVTAPARLTLNFVTIGGARLGDPRGCEFEAMGCRSEPVPTLQAPFTVGPEFRNECKGNQHWLNHPAAMQAYRRAVADRNQTGREQGYWISVRGDYVDVQDVSPGRETPENVEALGVAPPGVWDFQILVHLHTRNDFASPSDISFAYQYRPIATILPNGSVAFRCGARY